MRELLVMERIKRQKKEHEEEIRKCLRKENTCENIDETVSMEPVIRFREHEDGVIEVPSFLSQQ